MGIGIEVANSSGQIIFSTATRVAKLFGTMTRGSGDAQTDSVYESRFGQGTPWFYVVNLEQSTYQGYELHVWISGYYINWFWPHSTYRNETTVFYGVY